ncbi:MAG: hypothetical protein GXN98_02470 [Euryarchaeota archaeon]|nr:hypothetical protein [Euryarchaeota archaeon]
MFLLAMMLLPVVHADEAYIPGNYSTTPVFSPGDTVEVNVVLEDVEHAGFVAVNYYLIIYTTTPSLEVMDVVTWNVRYKKRLSRVNVTIPYTIPAGWREGTYFIKVRAYDVADEQKVRKMYVKALDWYSPEYELVRKFRSLPEGENVGGYDEFTKGESIATLVLSRTLRFRLERQAEVKPGVETQRYPVNVSYLLDGKPVAQPRFLADRSLGFNFSVGNAVHSGVVALDYQFVVVSRDGREVKYSTGTTRYLRFSGKEVSRVFTDVLPEYYLIVRVYDRANEEPLQRFLKNLLEGREYDTRKIDAYRRVREGEDVGDEPYRVLGVLKPRTQDTLVYFARIPFEVVPQLEAKVEGPVVKYLSIEPSKFVLVQGEPLTVKVKLKNLGKEGMVDVVLLVRGEAKGYELRKSIFMKPGEAGEVDFNLTMPLSEGPWKLSIANTSLREVVLVQSREVVERMKEFEKEFEPVKVQKPKLPLVILALATAGVLAFAYLMRRKHGRLPSELALPVAVAVVVQLVLIALYLVYLST